MEDPVQGKTLARDEDPHANDDAKAVMQEIVWRLMKDFEGQGADPADVAVALSQAIADAGLPEQPQQWVEATSIEIAGNREVVMDVKDQVEPERVAVGDETVNVLAPPTGLPDRPGGPRPGAPGAPEPTPQERAAE